MKFQESDNQDKVESEETEMVFLENAKSVKDLQTTFSRITWESCYTARLSPTVNKSKSQRD